MKCANCKEDALFEYQITLNKSVLFCGKHLPKFLELRKQAKLIKTTEKFEEAKLEAQTLLAPKNEAPLVVEELEEEKPKPKKKASKKKAE